jgi:hypothetical protein
MNDSMYTTYLVVLASIAGLVMLYNFFVMLLKSSIKLKLYLEPEEVEKGAPLRLVMDVEPQRRVTFSKVHGTLFAKKFDGYKGTWLEKQDMPYLASGIPLTRIKFKYGDNYEALPGELNRRIGVLMIPDDVDHTEYRGTLQTRWFLKVKAYMPLMPPIVIEDEVIVLRPTIYSGERLAFEEVKHTAGEDFYDVSEDDEEEKKKDSSGRSVEDDDSPGYRPRYSSPPPTIPVSMTAGTSTDKSSMLKVQYKAPFMAKQDENVMIDFKDSYGGPPAKSDDEEGEGADFFPEEVSEDLAMRGGFMGLGSIKEEDQEDLSDKKNLLKVQYKTPFGTKPQDDDNEDDGMFPEEMQDQMASKGGFLGLASVKEIAKSEEGDAPAAPGEDAVPGLEGAPEKDDILKLLQYKTPKGYQSDGNEEDASSAAEEMGVVGPVRIQMGGEKKVIPFIKSPAAPREEAPPEAPAPTEAAPEPPQESRAFKFRTPWKPEPKKEEPARAEGQDGPDDDVPEILDLEDLDTQKPLEPLSLGGPAPIDVGIPEIGLDGTLKEEDAPRPALVIKKPGGIKFQLGPKAEAPPQAPEKEPDGQSLEIPDIEDLLTLGDMEPAGLDVEAGKAPASSADEDRQKAEVPPSAPRMIEFKKPAPPPVTAPAAGKTIPGPGRPPEKPATAAPGAPARPLMQRRPESGPPPAGQKPPAAQARPPATGTPGPRPAQGAPGQRPLQAPAPRPGAPAQPPKGGALLKGTPPTAQGKPGEASRPAAPAPTGSAPAGGRIIQGQPRPQAPSQGGEKRPAPPAQGASTARPGQPGGLIQRKPGQPPAQPGGERPLLKPQGGAVRPPGSPTSKLPGSPAGRPPQGGSAPGARPPIPPPGPRGTPPAGK